ncbi:uncharacterized protein LOC131316338 isoform X1 [Rhododendron vialii]|uniref:uncharacterized protein LOC131316338 isoform X1 n=1 Tax=Rhododendron vialii TaxID=182163 RepID=UPI00265ED605|nr:uncharacterized protein LOC131316338 isoform X1 [Rhododendron vialii]
MGIFQSKNKKNPSGKNMIKAMREKLRHLEKEVSEIMWMRENESGAHERERVVHALKEGEWRRERKRLKEEVRKLRKRLEEREDEMVMREKKGCLVLEEQMREERERRDEAVEKWKRLYLAIKFELDDLIQRTHQGEGLYWRAEEEDIVLEELQQELRAKEETIENLHTKLASMEQEKSKSEREIDILRQSLKIMSHKKKPSTSPQEPLKKLAYVKQT